MKKVLAFIYAPVYNGQCCDMIAMKREVAADIYLPYGGRFFRGANALFTKLATSHCTTANGPSKAETTCSV